MFFNLLLLNVSLECLFIMKLPTSKKLVSCVKGISWMEFPSMWKKLFMNANRAQGIFALIAPSRMILMIFCMFLDLHDFQRKRHASCTKFIMAGCTSARNHFYKFFKPILGMNINSRRVDLLCCILVHW